MLRFVDNEDDWLGDALMKCFKRFCQGSASGFAYGFELESKLAFESGYLTFGASFSDAF
ncbi:MAG TPA: hypothetical protein VI653_30615 [Steroidobacteraceae bacterium]